VLAKALGWESLVLLLPARRLIWSRVSNLGRLETWVGPLSKSSLTQQKVVGYLMVPFCYRLSSVDLSPRYQDDAIAVGVSPNNFKQLYVISSASLTSRSICRHLFRTFVSKCSRIIGRGYRKQQPRSTIVHGPRPLKSPDINKNGGGIGVATNEMSIPQSEYGSYLECLLPRCRVLVASVQRQSSTACRETESSESKTARRSHKKPYNIRQF
jgi:hypothetical protein